MRTTELTIRPATEADCVRLAELSGQLGYPSPREEVEGRLRNIRRNALHEVYVAELGGFIAGWVHVKVNYALEGPEEAEIQGLVVDERHRGEGIGRRLVAEAEHWATVRGIRWMRVRSNVVRERALAFYEELQYERIKSQAVFRKALTP